jgi:hypothetical protein
MNIDAKCLFNQKKYIYKAKRILAIETDKIKKNVRLKIKDGTEDYTNKLDSCKRDTNCYRTPEQRLRK